MIEMPHDRRAIIYINALEAVQEESSEERKNQLNKDQVEKYLDDIEHVYREPRNIDEQLADLGMQISHAVIEGRTQDALSHKAKFIELAKAHPEGEMFDKIPQKISEHSVAGYDYRNYKGTTKGLQFGVVEALLNDNATIGIIGDWGTGDPDAQALLQEMKDKHDPDIYIHLGDIYNSCRWDEDVMPKFINIFNAVYPLSHGQATRPPILTIPGNHDYMSKGGQGFYKLIDSVNNHHPNWRQEASYFCLRTKNSKWQFLGADTGINDPSYRHKNEHPGLEPDEYAWHYDKMKTFASKGQGRTIFFTHHPLFSATHPLQDSEYVNKDLADNFNGYLTNGSVQSGEIRLWIWGHNHWFIPYVNTAKVKSATLDKGRLIGGSARHDYHNSSEIVNSGKHVIEYKKDGVNSVPLVPDSNNGLPNHTYCIVKLSDTDAEVTHYQIPSWHYNKVNPTKTLPTDQHNVLLREYILDTKPSQKYPKH